MVLNVSFSDREHRALVQLKTTATGLPTLPGVAMRIVQVLNDDEASVSDVVNAIQRDPALAAKILRVANSPLYGSRRTVESLPQAVVRLGQRATESLALSFSLVSALRLQQGSGLDYDGYWRRCLVSASAAKHIAARTRPADCEVGFLASLMQDLGMMIFDKIAPATYADLSLQDHSHLTVHENKLHRLGHPRLGAWLMGEWGFSKRIQEAVAYSHSPLDLPGGDADLVRCVALSAKVADALLQTGPMQHEGSAAASELFECADEWLSLTREDVAVILESMAVAIPSFERLFDTSLIDEDKLELLTLMAREKLTELRTATGQ